MPGSSADGVVNGEVSHWLRSSPAPLRAGLEQPHDHADLVVVGGGLTGLWTAYHALRRDPGTRVTLLEARHVGYGASGRNGGWLSPLLPGSRAAYARRAGRDGVVALQRALFDTIDDVLATLEREGIDAHQHRGGHLTVATTPAAAARIRHHHTSHRAWGYGEEDVRALDAHETAARVAVDGALGSLWFPGTARVDPARLVQGLADTVARLGARILEGTPALAVRPGVVRTPQGEVRGDAIVVCVEAATSALLGGSEVVPVNSSMIVTEPLPPAAWERIGWSGRECLGDAAHTFIYAQRTHDDRIAIGGRGTPYAFGSRPAGDGEVDAHTVRLLRRRLGELFPGVDLPVRHAWRGSLGVTRDWCASVTLAPSRRIVAVRGFAGHGVTATELAARTALDRLAGADTALTALPWNDHPLRRWEPEPLRWLGIRSTARLFALGDRMELRSRSERTALPARVGARLAGMD